MAGTPQTTPDLDTAIVANVYQNSTKDVSGAALQAQLLDINASIFNKKSDRYVFTQPGESTTTSSTLSDVVNKTTSETIAAGTFVVHVSFQAECQNAATRLQVTFQLDATNVANQAQILDWSPNNINEYVLFGAYVGTFTLGSDGQVDVDMQFASTDNTNTVAMRDIVVTLERLAAVNGWA